MLTLALMLQLVFVNNCAYFISTQLFGLPEAPDVRVINQGDQPFVCFTPDDAQKLLQLRLDLPLLKLKSEKLEESNLIREMEIRKLTASEEDLSDKLIDQQAFTKQLEMEINKKPVWYKHPVFWAFTGMAIGVLVYYVIDRVGESNQDMFLAQGERP